MNTHWTTPKRNMFAGMLDLRSALAAGMNARLVKACNEDCSYPIKVRNSITDYRAYEFSIGLLKTRTQILADERMPEFEKQLSLTFKTCYGTQEAVDKYYERGILSSDNFNGVGRSHLVRVEDMVRHFFLSGDKERGKMFQDQYFGEDTGDETHFFDHYRLKREHSVYTISRLKRKVWVVETLKDTERVNLNWLMFTAIGLLNAFCFPLKYIPTKSVLRMDSYKCVTFRIGAVTNGLSVEFHIPKKFGFTES